MQSCLEIIQNTPTISTVLTYVPSSGGISLKGESDVLILSSLATVGVTIDPPTADVTSVSVVWETTAIPELVVLLILCLWRWLTGSPCKIPGAVLYAEVNVILLCAVNWHWGKNDVGSEVSAFCLITKTLIGSALLFNCITKWFYKSTLTASKVLCNWKCLT